MDRVDITWHLVVEPEHEVVSLNLLQLEQLHQRLEEGLHGGGLAGEVTAAEQPSCLALV